MNGIKHGHTIMCSVALIVTLVAVHPCSEAGPPVESEAPRHLKLPVPQSGTITCTVQCLQVLRVIRCGLSCDKASANTGGGRRGAGNRGALVPEPSFKS